MVDFTKSISNQEMIDGLKSLLALNDDLAQQCQAFQRKVSDPNKESQLGELTKLHQRNVETLSDSLLFLGGAPDRDSRANKRSWFSSKEEVTEADSETDLAGLKKQEERLCQAYLEELDRLKASDEVVNSINKVRDETDDLMRSLNLWH